MKGLLSRHRGRHCRHGSLTGWSALAQLGPVVTPSRRRAPELLPVSVDDLIPFAEPRRHPYAKETSR